MPRVFTQRTWAWGSSVRSLRGFPAAAPGIPAGPGSSHARPRAGNGREGGALTSLLKTRVTEPLPAQTLAVGDPTTPRAN